MNSVRSRHHTFYLSFVAVMLLLVAVFSTPSGSRAAEVAPETAHFDAGTLSAIDVSALLPQKEADPLGIRRFIDATGGAAKVTMDPATGVVGFVSLPPDAALSLAGAGSPEAAADAFFRDYGQMFGISDAAQELARLGTRSRVSGGSTVTFQQRYGAVPVFGVQLKVHLNSAHQITAVNGDFIADIDLNSAPSLTADRAATLAVRAALAEHGLRNVSSDLAAVQNELVIFRTGLVQGIPGDNYLAYAVEVTNPAITIREFVYIDAHNGRILDRISGIHEGLDRKVSEATLANVIWEDSAGDPDPMPPGWAGGTAQQVLDWQNEIDGARETYNVIASLTGGAYLSYDGADATMLTVNNDPNIFCPNANWNGTSTNYCSGVTGDDTVAHEWGHAYTQFTNNLIYQWQSGALNESYSDIWGEVIDLLNGRQEDTPGGLRSDGGCSIFGQGAPSVDNTYRWLSGESDPAFGGAIRDMWNPNCYGDPGKVTDEAQYICTTFDSGGVHINSGIPNHAFALMTDGGTYNGETVSGIGLTKAAHIHWEAQNMLTPASDFNDHADALDAACNALIGVDLNTLSTETTTTGPSGEVISAADCAEVAKASTAVEFRTEPDFCNFQPLLDPNAPALCEGLGVVEDIHVQDWEAGLGSWIADTRDVSNPATFDTPDWAAVGSLPDGQAGQAAFVIDSPDLGDCVNDLETGVLYLESPIITLPATAAVPRLAFDHWVSTETGWDGGNLKVSVNGGAFTLVPSGNFDFNAYNSTLNPASAGNDNPMAGEAAFTGTDGGTVSGSWGQSQVVLAGLAGPGDDVQMRFEMGLDGCNGVIGWYVDTVELYACSLEQPGAQCGNGELNIGETCDDANTNSGDGCSDICLVEDGWECTLPDPPIPGTNVVADGSFEAGSPNPVWTEASTNFGTPLCTAGTCGGPGGSDGDWFAWFGGVAAFEAGSVEQLVTIPSTATDLAFDLQVGVCNDPTADFMRVLIDGAETYTTVPCATDTNYVTRSVDVSAFADDGSHMLRFESISTGAGGNFANFFLDNIVLSDNIATGGTPSVCTETSGIEVSPASLASTQAPNSQVDQTLTIANTGAGDLNWNITEATGLQAPLYPGRTVETAVAPTSVTIGDNMLAFAREGTTDARSATAVAVPTHAAAATTITHSLSQSIEALNAVSCNATGLHTDNSYLRVFDLTSFGITDDFDVTSVDVGVEVAAGAGGTQPATVNLYTLDGPLIFANLTLIGSASVDIADQALSIITVPVAGLAPAGSMLVVELFTPNGQLAGNSFFVGSNSQGETDFSYLAAADCGIVEPLTTGAVGFPNMHIVMNVTGDTAGGGACAAPGDVPWASAIPTSGTTPGGASSDVTVRFDSTGLPGGVYTGTLCVNSNDSTTPIVPVPLTLNVTGGGVPTILVDPVALASTQAPNTTVNETLTIGNIGSGVLSWMIEEVEGVRRPLANVANDRSVADNQSVTLGDNLLAFSETAAATSRQPARLSEEALAGATTITHSVSQTIEQFNSVSCNAAGLHTDNSYLRVFELADFGIASDFDVTEVSFGVEQAAGATGSQPLTVNLYTLDGPLIFANLTLIGSASTSVADQAFTIVTVPVTGTAPAGSTLVAEVFTPDGQVAGNSFFIGSNSQGETDFSYLAAADCGIVEPLTTGAVGFPNMHIVMNVTGDSAGGPTGCDAPSDIPWASVAPASGSNGAGTQTAVSVTFDSTGLAVGDYAGTLCVHSNDASNDLVEVPLNLTVEQVSAPIIRTVPNELSALLRPNSTTQQTLGIGNVGTELLGWNVVEDGSLALVDVIQDGGFEAGSPNPVWLEASTNFGTPLCTVAVCGTGTGTGPQSGLWWAWFGGIGAFEEGRVAQDVVIPSGAATLSFGLEQIVCDSPADFMQVLIDGTQVFLTDGTSALCGQLGYTAQSVDVSAWADDGTHTVEFHSQIFGNNGGGSNFFVDDVVLDVVGGPTACSAPSDIPWLQIAPTSGTTAPGLVSPVFVQYNAAGLVPGTYSANLCVSSNDPVTPLVVVPVTLEVEGRLVSFDIKLRFIPALGRLQAQVRVGDLDLQQRIAGATVDVTFLVPQGQATQSAVSGPSGWARYAQGVVGSGQCTVHVDNISLDGYVFDPGASVLTATIPCP